MKITYITFITLALLSLNTWSKEILIEPASTYCFFKSFNIYSYNFKETLSENGEGLIIIQILWNSNKCNSKLPTEGKISKFYNKLHVFEALTNLPLRDITILNEKILDNKFILTTLSVPISEIAGIDTLVLYMKSSKLPLVKKFILKIKRETQLEF